MPQDKPVPVTSNQGYNLSPAESQRVSDFVNSVGVKNKPSAVVILDPQQFSSIAPKMTGGAPTRTAFTIGDRIYLNGATLGSSGTSGIQQDLGRDKQNVRLAELALSHELAHMQDGRPRPWQEAHDSIYNAEGLKIFGDWQKSVANKQKQSAAAYQQLKEQSQVKVPQEIQGLIPNASGQDGTIQLAQAPVETNLIPPSLPSNVQKAVDQVRSQEAAHQAWLQSQSQTPSKYQTGQPQ